MYVTMRSYEGSSELADALVARQSEVHDVLAGIDGFRAYYLVRTGADSTTTISVYDDEEGTAESTRAAAAWLRENLPDLDVPAPTVTGGEAAISF
jgi:heme-degrading monooxygenase HmoA